MIEPGDKRSFVPAGFTAQVKDADRVRYEAVDIVTGEVEYINREHGFYRVAYKVRGLVFHECFPLEEATG